jgi:predicted aldo/keto reductase-like oxidoreductase
LPDDLKPAALRYALGLKGVSVVVVGIHDEAELKQDLAWARGYKPLSAEELKALDRRTRELAGKWGKVYGDVV